MVQAAADDPKDKEVAGGENRSGRDEQLEERKANWSPIEPKISHGYLARYARNVTSGSRGAIVE